MCNIQVDIHMRIRLCSLEDSRKGDDTFEVQGNQDLNTCETNHKTQSEQYKYNMNGHRQIQCCMDYEVDGQAPWSVDLVWR